MEVIVEYDPADRSIISVPQCIYEYVEAHLRSFFAWICDKSNNHKYWIYEGNSKFANCDANTFIEWLNDTILVDSTEKAFFVREVTEAETLKPMKCLYF
jgi:hypothetical protein